MIVSTWAITQFSYFIFIILIDLSRNIMLANLSFVIGNNTHLSRFNLGAKF